MKGTLKSLINRKQENAPISENTHITFSANKNTTRRQSVGLLKPTQQGIQQLQQQQQQQTGITFNKHHSSSQQSFGLLKQSQQGGGGIVQQQQPNEGIIFNKNHSSSQQSFGLLKQAQQGGVGPQQIKQKMQSYHKLNNAHLLGMQINQNAERDKRAQLEQQTKEHNERIQAQQQHTERIQAQQAQAQREQAQREQAQREQAQREHTERIQAQQAQAQQAQAQQAQQERIKQEQIQIQIQREKEIQSQPPKIIDLFAPAFIQNMASALSTILRDCGLDVNLNIRSINNDDIKKSKEPGRYLFICAPHTLLQQTIGLMAFPENKYFLYNFANGNELYLNTDIRQLITKAKHTFDYSETNLTYYPHDVKDKVSYLVPPVVTYSDDTNNEKMFDILFVGTRNERRETILNELTKEGFNVLNVTGVFGPKLTTLIRKSKIFLNIQDGNSTSLETYHLNEAVMSKDTHIISEKDNGYLLYGDRVHFVEKKDIVSKVKDVLTNNIQINIFKKNVYTDIFLKLQLLQFKINEKDIPEINNKYFNNIIDLNISKDSPIIRQLKIFDELIPLYKTNRLPYYINSIESFYNLYSDFDLEYYKNKYYKQTHLSDIQIMYDFHINDNYKKRTYNDKIKIVIYVPELYEKCGGVKALYKLAQKINNLQHKYVYAKIYCYNGLNFVNNYCNVFANPFEINDNTIVIYPEIISGNPLNAKHVIRWILLELGIEMDKNHYLNWNKSDIIYHWEPNTTKNIKQLALPFIDDKIKNNNNGVRAKTCFLIKKGILIHGSENIRFIHPPDSINIDNMSLDDIVETFNNSHTFYCYDPNSFYTLSATLCGCISVIYPVKNIDKDTYFKNRITYIDNFTYNSGIAYGNSHEQITHAKRTIKDAQNNMNLFLKKYDSCVSNIVDDLYNYLTYNKKLLTIENEYY